MINTNMSTLIINPQNPCSSISTGPGQNDTKNAQIDSASFRDELINASKQYLDMKSQITEKPEVLSDIINKYVPEDEAAKIMAFLDGKNVTAIRYQHLLETNPESAAYFIDAKMNYDYTEHDSDADKLYSGIRYEDFISEFNNYLVDVARTKADGSYILPEQRHMQHNFKGLANIMLGDHSYGTLFKGIKGDGAGNLIYLSLYSNEWLSFDEWQTEFREYNPLDDEISQNPATTVQGMKPIGYGNTEAYTFTHNKDKLQTMNLFNTAEIALKMDFFDKIDSFPISKSENISLFDIVFPNRA